MISTNFVEWLPCHGFLLLTRYHKADVSARRIMTVMDSIMMRINKMHPVALVTSYEFIYCSLHSGRLSATTVYVHAHFQYFQFQRLPMHYKNLNTWHFQHLKMDSAMSFIYKV